MDKPSPTRRWRRAKRPTRGGAHPSRCVTLHSGSRMLFSETRWRTIQGVFGRVPLVLPGQRQNGAFVFFLSPSYSLFSMYCQEIISISSNENYNE
jgi:hypothetical protein